MGDGAMIKAAVIVIACLLTGCSMLPTRTVQVPVIVPCLGDPVSAPEYKAGIGEYPGDAEAVKLYAADLVKAKGYSDQLKARMSGCN